MLKHFKNQAESRPRMVSIRFFAPSSKMMRMPSTQTVLSKLEQIETEMRRIQLWQQSPLQAEQYDFKAAFASDTMSFPQWLQFIFIPSVKRAAANENFPSSSQVGVMAVR